MKQILAKAVVEIGQNREDILKQTLLFAQTDMLFFWAENENLFALQQEKWQPILDWAEQLTGVKLVKTEGFEVPENSGLEQPLRQILAEMNDKELAGFYAAALNMRSVLLALALLKRRLSAEDAWELSYLEELWQNQYWGVEETASNKRQERRQELVEIESFLAA